MRIQFTQMNLWGNLSRKEMEIIYQSNKMVIARYPVGNLQSPLVIDGSYVLENGYTAVAFIEYGNWYITEKIFDFQARPTGFLINVVTPVEENLTFLNTMDLFVKVWISPGNQCKVFGTNILRKIAEDGFLTETVEKSALETVNTLVSNIKKGVFPPQFVKDFCIENNREFQL
jgi:predicted RNA-binding protein associated with RNAse of E/G family